MKKTAEQEVDNMVENMNAEQQKYVIRQARQGLILTFLVGIAVGSLMAGGAVWYLA